MKLWVMLSIFLVTGMAHAGVVVSRSGMAIIGTVQPSATNIVVTIKNGRLEFQKEMIAWYATSPEIDSFLDAFHVAQTTKQPIQLQRTLLQLSYRDEPDTRALVRELYAAITPQSAHAGRSASVKPGTVLRQTAGPNVHATISTEVSDFRGWINYGSPMYINGVRVPNNVYVPVFGSIGANSTVIVGTGGSTVIAGDQ